MHTLLLLATVLTQSPDTRAHALVDSAIARMGGPAVLQNVVRVRMEMMTQWQRISFENLPYGDQPSYEWHTDVRDYSIPAWRNTRRFFAGNRWQERTDIVRDSVAIRGGGGAPWAPLNVAYVDERRELFTFAADRLMLLARQAETLELLPDTTIGRVRHARLRGTIAGFPTTIFVRRADGLPAMVRYLAAQPNDFGLAPWGTMEVELWYSRWQKTASGAVLPLQWDVRRVGRPYKRLTVMSMAFDTVATADSFAVSDSLRGAYLATATRPMYDLPLDSARVLEGRFATFGAFGPPVGAVKVGSAWVLLEAGQAPLITERSVNWLKAADPGATISAAVITAGSGGNGGAAWLAREGIPIHVAPGSSDALGTVMRNHQLPARRFIPVDRGRWIRAGGDSLWVEPIDYPDATGAVVIYVPSLKWVYSSLSAGALQRDFLLARLRQRGWQVERFGSARGLTTPLPRG